MSLNLSSINPFSFFKTTDLSKSSTPIGSDRTVYFDFCTMHYWSLTDSTTLKTYTEGLMDQFSGANITDISLAFAQICNIDELVSPSANPSAQTNLFGYILKNYPNVLPAFVDAAHNKGLQVHLSFGGENAGPNSLQICQNGQTPEQQAANVLKFLNEFKLDGVNFDIEGAATNDFISENQNTLLPFVKNLHQQLQKNNKKVTLTTEANHKVLHTLDPLFFDSEKKPIFTSLFDGLYLMNYDSGARYYIDANDQDGPANQVDWGIQTWIDAVTQSKANYLHVGFQDATPYENPSASAGKKYSITSSERGDAAYQIYNQMLSDLKKNSYTTQLGQPFWWPDEGSMSGRYNISTSGKGDFKLQTIESFYKHFSSSLFTQLKQAIGF